MPVHLVKASLEDITALQQICTEAYSKNFYDHWDGNGLDLYLASEFGETKLQADVSNEHLEYYFICKDDRHIGFVQLNHYQNLPDKDPAEGSELKKIYLLPNNKGGGLGTKVLQQVISIVKGKGKKKFFLQVIDHNVSAIGFYEKAGFRFHSKTTLDAPLFKEELREMNRMYLDIG